MRAVAYHACLVPTHLVVIDASHKLKFKKIVLYLITVVLAKGFTGLHFSPPQPL